MPQTPQEYYDDESNYGNYQYVSLGEILDGMLMEVGLNEDHYLKNVKRALLLRYAKHAIREVTRQAANQVQQFSITVPNTLTFPLPQDYVSYIRAMRIVLDQTTSSYRLYPLDTNNNINTAPDYLQDNLGDLLFDGDGYILEAEGLNALARPYHTYSFCRGPYTDASLLSAWGEVVIDENRGIMAFSSDLSEQNIVFRYVSDGLQASLSESEIRVHKYLRTCIEDYIYHKGIDRNRNVSQGDKYQARNRYLSSLHKAKLAMADIDLLRIARTLRANPIP